MIVLIPMAGDGLRFKNEGYKTPKPLIEIDGLPMVVRAAKDLPKGTDYIFICRYFHITEYHLDEVLLRHFPNAKIIIIDYLTEGQAATCLLAEEYINTQTPIFIGASDNGLIYDKELFNQTIQDADAVAFTFRNHPAVVENPHHYGWLLPNAEGVVEKVSVKVPLSNYPKTDHAIVGAFWFKKGSEFVELTKQMIQDNKRINHEFYVDSVLQEFLNHGKRVKIFEVDYYLGWGTPNDLRTFQYWQTFFDKMEFHPYKK